MIHFFREVRVLREEGKIHSKLINRTRMLFGIACILLCITVYNLASNLSLIPFAAGLGAVGFVLGLYIFSRMNVVNWDEQAETVVSGRMDILGYGAIGLYIIFEISLRTFLGDFFPASATAYLLAGIFGTILGRAVGTVLEIHQVYRASHGNV